MGTTNQMRELIQLESEIKEMLEEQKEDIAAAVREVPSQEGVETIASDPRCAVVSLSTLMKNGYNLSASTYIPASQADAVEKKLAKSTSVTALVKNLEEMAETKRVKVGNEVTNLNEGTISAIKGFIPTSEEEEPTNE